MTNNTISFRIEDDNDTLLLDLLADFDLEHSISEMILLSDDGAIRRILLKDKKR